MLDIAGIIGTARPRRAHLLALCALAAAQGYVLTPRQPSTPHSRQGPVAPATRNTPVVAAFDTKGLKAAGIAALTSLSLVASPVPAYAKGGGHGGGHSHHSHHSRPSYPRSSTSSYRNSHPSLSSSLSSSSRSRRRSGSRRSGSSNVFPSAREENIRIYPTAAEARENGGLMCPEYGIPKVGAKVDIMGGDGVPKRTATVLRPRTPPAGDHRSSLSQPAGFDGGCALQVQYTDGTTDSVSLAKAPPSELEDLAYCTLGGIGLFAQVYFLGGDCLAGSLARREYEEMRERLMEPRGESPSNPAEGPRRSGEFQGGSSESDGGHQDIRVTLRLTRDGNIAGLGRDGVDGSYMITRGRWDVLPNGNLQLAWEESYDKGLVAICEGEYDTTSGMIRGRFASSRSVNGSFMLTRQQ